MTLIQSAISTFAYILNMLIFARCIISWIPIGQNGPIVRILYILTEPVLGPIRALIEKSPLGGPGMMIDFSPMIALLFVSMISRFVIGLM